MSVKEIRQPGYPAQDLIVERWSPRAMSGEPISEEQLMTLFEAARWAPSCFNEQPWHFFYATRDGEHWDGFFKLLVEFNQMWCKNASVLMVICSRDLFQRNNRPNRNAAYDTGAAWQNLALQASSMGLVCHGMAGFDYDKARMELNIPGHLRVEAMCAVGHPGNKDDLPEDLREKEAPSLRNPIEEFTTSGPFG